MARTRRTPTPTNAPTTKSTSQAAGGEFTCPECGRAFARAAALGAHRRRAHNVAGAASRRRAAAGRSRSRTARTTGTRSATATRRATDDNRAAINRDALLQTLFPNGLPAREAVIRAANEWLDRAEQLAKMK